MSNPTHIALPAPAKINRMLHITGRRSDGYHQLQTLFQFLDYGDQLTFALRHDGRLTLTPALDQVALEDNLIIRAARLLQTQSGTSLGCDITLKKQLPMGGGLGGGSSDAATALMGLNHLWQLGYSAATLATLGLTLGADIPVFVHGQAAWAEGIGECLTPVELDTPVFLVIHPGCHCATGAVFTHPDLTRDSAPINLAAALKEGGRNDCEAVVRRLYPAVDQAINWLNRFASAHLTGTGACIFAAFTDMTEANAVLAKLPETFSGHRVTGFVAQGTNCSSLLTAMKKLA
ncbi:4-(cytidine 5'-diphospho)-2-C-methyl-D-erythritol kinase [Terasakiispira papahanaumokuakeensis]|uniref:4-diphosphocytidyl-2-C-methyl-D-erythritol kinase n=1 Tax=Terasakiispira papahanaumokuakeensis TaxID=197479 RepID=A0A1E2V6J1_9GAMM|nr:4-(cytidine 5'-diphospho)-2-C-methyl-D-erythritol kinase [Terasakiispira papahanaumokuakeensis]ODC02638.1 4-(cytidine 5'-diphospho)-2-C-methyl-D-erythritol kinase [Terasakiispira papahanaumokuakeensis]